MENYLHKLQNLHQNLEKNNIKELISFHSASLLAARRPYITAVAGNEFTVFGKAPILRRLLMQLIQRLFRDHPESVGETYLEHLLQASYFGARMFLAGLACLIHAVIPCLFKTTGRAAISELHSKMVLHRTKQTD